MPTDYKLDDGLDLSIVNGDFSVVESTKQHQHLLLITTPGEYKQRPTAGVGLSNYLLDERSNRLHNAIQSEFTKDGMKVEDISLSEEGMLTIKASYE